MKTRMLPLFVATALAVGLVSASQAGEIPYKASYEGTVLDTAHDVIPDPYAPGPLYADVVRAQSSGTYGQSDTVIVTEFALSPFQGTCDNPDDLRMLVGYSKAVVTYSKGDQLYLSTPAFDEGNPEGAGYLCLNMGTGDFEGLALGTFVGGTGRFENASGEWQSRFSGRNLTVTVPLPFGFSSIHGLTSGTLELN